MKTDQNELYEGINASKFTKIKRLSKEGEISSQLEHSEIVESKFNLKNSELFTRNTRSLKSSFVSIKQSEQLCGGFEIQPPCTCYHPDHPDVTKFELDTDETTQNASSLNGTGPASCKDLQFIGYRLSGFYLVRFKPNIIKAIYCGFNQEIQSLSNENEKTNIFSKHGDAGSSKMIRFCTGSECQPCTFLYSDYPEIPLFHPKKNKPATKNTTLSDKHTLEPTNCISLEMMGHGLRGFYVVRFNALKVKIIFCDFDKTIESSVTQVRTKRLALKKNETASSKNITRVCKEIWKSALLLLLP